MHISNPHFKCVEDRNGVRLEFLFKTDSGLSQGHGGE